MKRSFVFAVVALAAVLTVPAFAQQQFINEDFSTAAGLNPPAGWSVITLLGGPGDGWRFDNPSARTINAPLAAPVAIVDTDNAGILNVDTILRTPAFSTAGAAQVLLDFDQVHVPLGSQTDVIVVAGGTSTTVYTNTAGTANPEHTNIDITAACGGNIDCTVRFRHQGNFDWYQMVDNVMITEPSPVDVGATALLSPSSGPGACNTLTNMEAITVEITNFGTAVLPSGTMIPISYDVNASGAVNETFTLAANLNPGATDSYTFATLADLSGAGAQNIDAATALGGDGNATNDMASFSVSSANIVTSFPFSENFDTQGFVNGGTAVPTDWINVQGENAGGGDSDWESLTGATGSVNTGPTGDNTTGSTQYFYIEDTGGEHAAVNLQTPCFDLSGVANPRFSFFLHSLNDNIAAPNSFSLDVVTYPGGFVVSDVFGPQGDLGVGDMWVKQNIDLSAFAGGTIRCQFRGSSNNGWFAHDQAIDDVGLVDFVPGPGQAPVPGVATFDINNSVTANGDPVSTGVNGPYFASATVGGFMNFTFGGNPNQPLLCFTGPLNPGVLVLGPIGQVDVGTPDGMGGVTSVSLIGDGAAPADFVDTLFRIGASGSTLLSFQIPGVLMGANIPIQCVMFGGPFGVALSNAVDLTIM